MQIKRKKTIVSALTTTLIVVVFMTLLRTTAAPQLVITARPGPPGTYELDIYGDASALAAISTMVHHFQAKNLEWSTSMPSHPSSVDFALAVRNVKFDQVNAWTYHLSVNGLTEGSIVIPGYTNFIFEIKARIGDVEFTFANPSMYPPGYYRNVTIAGTLRGNVLFHIAS
ncbi:MAG: hypothetical protein NWE82_00670, partial [Candidatus Bathyarchaeota archaeon]|nr:hypothetical protein [Candidatus Bathyarchaeota archaeon]